MRNSGTRLEQHEKMSEGSVGCWSVRRVSGFNLRCDF